MKILVAGIGNIFCGDDGFGGEAIRELNRRGLPSGVAAMDFGIRSYDLACALTDDFDAVILVDAVPRGGEPGSLYLIEPEVLEQAQPVSMDAHVMNPVAVIKLAQSFGGIRGKLFLVGCEPGVLNDEDGTMCLSPRVQEAIPGAVEMILSLVEELFESTESKIMAGLAPA